jgi:hypothetical protein
VKLKQHIENVVKMHRRLKIIFKNVCGTTCVTQAAAIALMMVMTMVVVVVEGGGTVTVTWQISFCN